MKNDIPQKYIMRNIYSNLNIKGLSKGSDNSDLINNLYIYNIANHQLVTKLLFYRQRQDRIIIGFATKDNPNEHWIKK